MYNKSIIDFLHFNNPTKEQETVLKAMENFVKNENQYDFMVLCGAAGTGKTSVTAALIGYLNEKKIPYKISAPTGRAARILGRKSKTTASTIHSLIYSPNPDRNTGSVSFRLKRQIDKKTTIYIIDEASMVSKEVDKTESLFKVDKGLVYDLIEFVKKANANNKMIFLGDHYQLPPVGESESFALNKDFLEETFNLKGLSFLLKEVKRQEDGSYILQDANEIRKAIDENKKKHPLPGIKNRSIYSAADKYVREIKSDGLEKSVIISSTNKSNKFFNDLVRERVFKNAKKILEPGDLLMVVQNWYRNGVQLYNGDHVKLVSVDWNLQEQVAGLHFAAVKVKLLFTENDIEIEDYALLESLLIPGGRINPKLEKELRKQRYIKNKLFRESNMPGDDRYVGALRLIYGHAITCHKAQGGEWKKVYINSWGIPSLKWQYTAVTRGIEDVESF